MVLNPPCSINYRETHFDFPTLTPIRGELTTETLLNLKKQLKSNARSVPSNLGGEQFGHLGLVIPPNQYNLISNMPFVCPGHPGPLVIPPGTTQHAAATMQDLHQEALRVFIEVKNAVDKALIQQINQAIEPEYLSALHNQVNNSINIPVFDVLTHLENSYGNVEAEALQARDNAVSCMSYPLAQPIYMIFNVLDDLAHNADLSDSHFTKRQIMAKALIILNCTQHFLQPILEWKR